MYVCVCMGKCAFFGKLLFVVFKLTFIKLQFLQYLYCYQSSVTKGFVEGWQFAQLLFPSCQKAVTLQ